MKLHICKYCGESFEHGYLLGNHVSKICQKNPDRGRQISHKSVTYNWVCTCCGSTFNTRRELQSHRKLHRSFERNSTHKYSHVMPLAKQPCQYCGRVCKYLSGLHLHEKCCSLNPNRIYLPKQSDIMTDATKRKISDSLKKYYTGKSIWYTSRTHRLSYAERYFSKIFTNATRNYHVDRYFLDFAWPSANVYVEVDGEQHYTATAMQRDTERTDVLSKCGWTLIRRIRWSDYQKLTHDAKRLFVQELVNELNAAILLTNKP